MPPLPSPFPYCRFLWEEWTPYPLSVVPLPFSLLREALTSHSCGGGTMAADGRKAQPSVGLRPLSVGLLDKLLSCAVIGLFSVPVLI